MVERKPFYVGPRWKKFVTDSLAPAHGASYRRHMKRNLILLAVLIGISTLSVWAQDAALLEERVKQLKAIVDDLNEDKLNQKKQIEALAKEVQSLRDQLQNQPNRTYASQEDLRALAKQVQEVENKRRDDVELILKQIEKLKTPGPKTSPPRNNAESSRPTDGLPDKAIEHTIASGDTLSTIAAAYNKEKGLKLTTGLILKANPGLDANKLRPGQKIMIPLVEK